MNFYITKNDFGRNLLFNNLERKGYYSINEDRKVEFNSSQLRYYVERRDGFVNLDLTKGIESTRLFSNTSQNLDNILKWIQKNYKKDEKSSKGERWLDADFILRRGLIERLLQTPYAEQNDWIICAAKWKGNIYLCRFDTKAEIMQKKNMTPFHFLATCWGHKFQQYMLSDAVDKSPDTSKPVDQNLQFCCVFQSSLGENSLLYSSDVNGVCSDENLKDPLPLDKLKCVELKTTRVINSPRNRTLFTKYATLSIWSKCVPVGVDKIVCGFRDRQGMVKELKTYTRNDFLNMSKKYWRPSIAMSFANDFLTHIKNVVVNNCDETIYKFERSPDCKNIKITEVSPNSSYAFLPKWYTEGTMHCYRKSAPAFDSIKVKGYFSLTDKDSIVFDSSELRYYNKNREFTNVHFDLNDGIENAVIYTESFMNRHMDKILYWIKEYHETIEENRKGEKWLQPNFICRRGVIDRLLKTPYTGNEAWTICAAKWRGSIYLCEFYDVEETSPSPPTRWGHKFEQYILSDIADELPDTTKPVNENTQFCCVFQSVLGSHSLLYSAEMDALCSDKTLKDPLPLDELEFIELKTTRTIDTPNHRKSFAKYTSLAMWSQCIPVGINDVLCGFKDKNGIVREVTTFNLEDLEIMSKFYWTPAVSLNFLNDFLTYVNNVVVNNCDTTIYKFESNHYDDVIHMSEVSPSSQYSFLPEWYKYQES